MGVATNPLGVLLSKLGDIWSIRPSSGHGGKLMLFAMMNAELKGQIESNRLVSPFSSRLSMQCFLFQGVTHRAEFRSDRDWKSETTRPTPLGGTHRIIY
jgi:hypothetical protein